MAYKFSDEDKEVREFRESLPFGVHEVQFIGAIADVTEAGKDFIEIGMVNKEGIEGAARVWFVGGASNISFNTLHAIAVHQGKDEEEKEKIRKRMDKCVDTDEMVEVLNDVCGNGGKFWYRKEYDPTRKYQNANGETKRSINTNIFGYEPKLRPELMPAQADENGDPLPGAEKVEPGSDAAKNIPKDWA
jgi:hypothetical protein